MQIGGNNMSKITLKGNDINTNGSLPAIGSGLPAVKLVGEDLSEVSLSDFKGKKKILNIFPSVDTSVCAASVNTFVERLKTRNDVVLLNISKDLPFALSRGCSILKDKENMQALSAFRSSFALDLGLEMVDGPLKGLCSRAIIVVDENDNVLYTEQVPEITTEPDYEKAVNAL